MSAETTEPQRTYGGWQQEKVAFLFGLSALRAAMLSGAVLAAITPVGVADMPAAAVFWPAALVLAAAALIRVGGRTGDEWLAGLASYMIIRARGQHRFAGGPFAPSQAAAAGARAAGEPQARRRSLDLPGILAPLRILSVPAAGHDLAVVENRHDRTWTAVARVRFPGIGLADSARREARVAGWGALLASLCTEGTPLVRVQALQRLVPESGAALRSWHAAHLAPGAPELARRHRGRAARLGYAHDIAPRGVPGVHDGCPPRPRPGQGGRRRRARRGGGSRPPPEGTAPGDQRRRPGGRGLARHQGPGRGDPHGLRPRFPGAPGRPPCRRRRRPGRAGQQGRRRRPASAPTWRARCTPRPGQVPTSTTAR